MVFSQTCVRQSSPPYNMTTFIGNKINTSGHFLIVSDACNYKTRPND